MTHLWQACCDLLVSFLRLNPSHLIPAWVSATYDEIVYCPIRAESRDNFSIHQVGALLHGHGQCTSALNSFMPIRQLCAVLCLPHRAFLTVAEQL